MATFMCHELYDEEAVRIKPGDYLPWVRDPQANIVVRKYSAPGGSNPLYLFTLKQSIPYRVYPLVDFIQNVLAQYSLGWHVHAK
jgi:hypothetical protein